VETGIRQNIKLTKLKQGHKTKYNRDIKQNRTGINKIQQEYKQNTTGT